MSKKEFLKASMKLLYWTFFEAPEKYTFGYQQAQKDDLKDKDDLQGAFDTLILENNRLREKIDKLQLALNIERDWSERLKKELLLQKQWSEATVKEAKKRGIKEFYTYPLIIKKIKGVN